MIALLLAALVVQAEPPTLDASVDQDRVTVGEEVTYRLRATSRSQAPMELTVAPFTGLETVSRSERTELSLGATRDAHHGARGPAPGGAAGPVAARPGPGGAGP